MENSSRLIHVGEPRWFVAKGEAWLGPWRQDELLERVERGEIAWIQYACREGEAEVRRLCDIPELAELGAARPSTQPLAPPRAAHGDQPQAGVPEPKDSPEGLLDPIEDLEILEPTATGVRGARSGARLASSAPRTQTARSSASAAPSVVPVVAREWFLFYDNAQFGPFSREEILTAIAQGTLSLQAWAWRDGMAQWERLAALDGLGLASPAAPSPSPRVAPLPAQGVARPARLPAEPSVRTGATRVGSHSTLRPEADRRRGPRRPLVARIFIGDPSDSPAPRGHSGAKPGGKSGARAAHDTHEAVVGVCRDISVGGLQILTALVPGAVGETIKLSVSPSGGPATRRLDPFLAEGEIVRILEDGRGFSLRFTKLPITVKRAIEQYLGRKGS